MMESTGRKDLQRLRLFKFGDKLILYRNYTMRTLIRVVGTSDSIFITYLVFIPTNCYVFNEDKQVRINSMLIKIVCCVYG